MNRIWWIASYPKSGNTWLRMLLSAYRNGGAVDINRPHDASLDDIHPYFYQAASPVPLADLDDLQRLLLRPAALLHMTALSPPGQPLLVKTHFANCIIGGQDAVPAALSHGAVYLVRDPRDVAASLARHQGISTGEAVTRMGRSDYMIRRGPLFHHLASWSEHVRSWSERSAFPVLVVRYEDMVADTAGVFRAVLRFLRHEVDEELLARAVEAASFPAQLRR